MTGSEREPDIRRILVAVDASAHSLSALDAAAELAASLQADLVGLFIEDINLLRLGELPSAREIGVFSGTSRLLNRQSVQRQLQVQAQRVREALASAADEARVRWTFSVRRGQIASELLTAASDADLVVLGKASWASQTHLGSTALAFLAQGRVPTMILQRGSRLRLPMLVLYDGSEYAQKALAIAALLAHAKEDGVVVVLVGDTAEVVRDLRRDATAWLADRGVIATYRFVSHVDAFKLCQVVQQEAGGLLVFHRDTPSFRGEELVGLLNEIGCPVMLVQ